jgi:hypothetical protein
VNIPSFSQALQVRIAVFQHRRENEQQAMQASLFGAIGVYKISSAETLVTLI